MKVLRKKIMLALYLMFGQSLLVAMESKPNLILGLDDVLVHEKSEDSNDVHKFFSEKSFLINDCQGFHYIVPAYLPEFLTFAITKFNVAFFGHCSGQRDRSIINNIWLKIFQLKMPKNVPILSKEDLTYADNNLKLQPEDLLIKYGRIVSLSLYKDYKKDITKIGGLSSTIIADNDMSWALRGQLKNFLSVPSPKLSWFKKTIETRKNVCDYNTFFTQKSEVACQLIGFYKLLYIAGILDKALEHKDGIVAGLYDIQFEHFRRECDLVMKGSECMLDLVYYKRGYKVLMGYSNGGLRQCFPVVEKLFQD